MKDPSLRANARVCSPQETETLVSVTPSYLASESLHGGADRLPRPQHDERHSAVRLRRRTEHGSPEQLFVPLSTTMPSKYLHFIRAEELTPPLPTFVCHHGSYCAQANASSPRTKGSPRLAKS